MGFLEIDDTFLEIYWIIWASATLLWVFPTNVFDSVRLCNQSLGTLPGFLTLFSHNSIIFLSYLFHSLRKCCETALHNSEIQFNSVQFNSIDHLERGRNQVIIFFILFGFYINLQSATKKWATNVWNEWEILLIPSRTWRHQSMTSLTVNQSNSPQWIHFQSIPIVR